MPEYQLTKTIRFGLTLKQSPKKHETHQYLKELCLTSEDRIKKDTKLSQKFDENKMLEDVHICLKLINKYISEWSYVYTRADQIALTKNFYKILSKKACFDYDKKNKPQLLKLSSLSPNIHKDYIIDYFRKNISNTKQAYDDFYSVFNQYKFAVDNPSQAHKKPNLVNFRKMFLSLSSLVNHILIPLCNESICFPYIDKLNDEDKNNKVKKFVSQMSREERENLIYKIQELKEYFESIGGYVPFGRVTLNKYTAQQKPHKFDLNNPIRDLGLINLIKKFKDKSKIEIFDYFKKQNKKELLDNKNISIIESAQAFKFKTIPAEVRFLLADYLAKEKEYDQDKIKELFDAIGRPFSIGEDYLNNKENFNIYEYPLKIAFDYAWENLARSLHHEKINFPKDQSEKFLKDIFEVDINNENFRLYADLLFVKECLSTLENNAPKDKKKFIDHIKRIIANINDNKYNKDKEAILNWVEEKKNKSSNKYREAKNKLGLLRGRQKNDIKNYKEMTETFKTISQEFGRNFAQIRDKLREQNELNKIAYSSLIIEDLNQDSYLLLTKLNENRETNSIPYEENQGELKTYQVKSLTSKTLTKIIKNIGGYKDFHCSEANIDKNNIKKDWQNYQNNETFLSYLKNCISSSRMAKVQNWNEFNLNLSDCQTYLDIEREIDQKAYILKEGKISKRKIEELVNNQQYLLLPIVNQDLTSEKRILKNQFSKDWRLMFSDNKEHRLHPEFNVVYRHPTPGYPNPGEKRYSRFQMIANFTYESIPPEKNYISKKEQIRTFNNIEKQKEAVENFNNKIKFNSDYYIFGIDRGLRQLATLCILDKNGNIQNNFDIYTRKFNSTSKQWNHTFLEKRAILDLSNLRVEATIDGKRVLVDLAEIKVKGDKENQQKIKLKQLSYIRKLQYKMQNDRSAVNDFIKQGLSTENIENNLILPYKEGNKYSDLPIEEIKEMLTKYKEYISNENDETKKDLQELCELDASYKLKNGVVANMIGVIAYLLEKYNYNVCISLENLCFAYNYATDGLTGEVLNSTKVNKNVDFKEQENKVLAGLGTYQFFEIQLLKKLFNLQKDLVPAFRSKANYEKIVKKTKEDGDEYVNYPFGIIRFVDPRNTSKKCPGCQKNSIKRNHNNNDSISCDKCRFPNNNNNQNSTLKYIKNGDDNGAYQIALKAQKNINN